MMKHDVLVNYSSEDTGRSKGFVSHLKGALRRRSFSIYDHTMIPIGCDMSSHILKAIEDSEIYVVVFSNKYAFSVRCLDELVDIVAVNCSRKFNERKIFPVFYNVKPSNVKSQLGSFKKAFEAHKNNFEPERVRKWRLALREVGELSGLYLQNGDEESFVSVIVKELEKMQNPQDLYVADCPVGIDARAEEIILCLRSDADSKIVAIQGISGSGKTTLAKEVYNRLSRDFDNRYFLTDLSQYAGSPDGKVALQNMFISCLTQDDKYPIIQNHNDAITRIKKLVCHRKALVVLDDVDSFEQLEALGILPNGFSNGSRIIVTTRDKQSLGSLPHTSLSMRLLNRREGFELFTKTTFRKDEPIDKKFVKEVVACAGGLPLVLKVLGCHFKQHEREQWPSILEKLKRIPHDDVQKKLQISYDSLRDRAKKLFLDIAFSFHGMKRGLVVKVLHNEELAFYADLEIQRLVDKGLVKIGRNSELLMHHAIKKMALEVVRQENEDEPGHRTRLRDHRDVYHVLAECSGTDSVESIRLDTLETKERVTVQVEALRKMSNLRLIRFLDSHLWYSSINNDMSSFSFKKLKYLEWYGFPCKHLNFDIGSNVAVIRLQHSKLEILWNGVKNLKKLRILDVGGSFSLKESCNFDGLENLEEVHFGDCRNIEELHNSIGHLEKLVLLDISCCTHLKQFPWEMIGKLQCLQNLNLSHCPNIGLEHDEVIDHFLSSLKGCSITQLQLAGCNIRKISGEIGGLKCLEYLNLSENRFPTLPDSLDQLHELNTIELSGCAHLQSISKLPPKIKYVIANDCISLVNLPSNMSELRFLRELMLDGCVKLASEGLMEITKVTSLRDLSMKNCNFWHVPKEVGNLVFLESLALSGNTFSSLPDSFSNLSQLVNLEIDDCLRLLLLPLLPAKLTNIEASGCCFLDLMTFDTSQMTYYFRYKVCKESPFTRRLEIHLTVEEVPKWCSYRNRGDVLSFIAPTHFRNKICGVILCATLEFKNVSERYLTPKMFNKTRKTSHRLKVMTFPKCCTCIMFYPLDDTTLVVEPADIVLLQFLEDGDPVSVSSCGLRLMYEGDVVDSKLVLQNVTEFASPILLETTNLITQLNDIVSDDDDSLSEDDEYYYYE